MQSNTEQVTNDKPKLTITQKEELREFNAISSYVVLKSCEIGDLLPIFNHEMRVTKITKSRHITFKDTTSGEMLTITPRTIDDLKAKISVPSNTLLDYDFEIIKKATTLLETVDYAMANDIEINSMFMFNPSFVHMLITEYKIQYFDNKDVVEFNE